MPPAIVTPLMLATKKLPDEGLPGATPKAWTSRCGWPPR